MKIICFSSHTSTWYFALAEAVIALALQKKGHDVLYITPGNQFGGISNLDNEKIIRKELNLKGYEIGTVLTDKDNKEIEILISRLNRKNFSKLVIDDVQIGKIALYEFLIIRKKMDVNFTADEWKECLFAIKNTLISFYACRRILKMEKPDRVLMYSTLYSVNRAWERCASSKKIPVYYLHHGLNFSDIDNTLIIAKDNTFYYLNNLKKEWAKLKEVAVNRGMLNYVTDHFLELLKANHYLVYSAPKSKQQLSIRKIFDIKRNQKILTATMSSYDEMFAAEYVGAWKSPKKLIFKNQTDWVKQLIGYVRNKKDLFLIIRVHPREFPNKRDGVKSEHAKILENVFKNLPNNVKINWPTDNISIYDLAQETDVFLNAWSTVGVEMSLLGIPVVIYSKELVHYPSNLNYVAENLDDYFMKIESALNDGWSYEKIKKTYRWLALYYCRTIMRIKRKKQVSSQSKFSKFVSIVKNCYYISLSPKIRHFIVKFAMIALRLGVVKRQRDECKRQLKEHIDISSVEKMLVKSENTLVDLKSASKNKVPSRDEDIFIRRQIKRIYKAMYGSSPERMNIEENSLQNNLRRVAVKSI